jgi:hydrogenase/urease accessory protein HupE
MKSLTAALSLLCFSAPALAHPGAHGGSVLSVLEHLLSQPDHRAVIVMGLVSLVVALALIPSRGHDDSR